MRLSRDDGFDRYSVMGYRGQGGLTLYTCIPSVICCERGRLAALFFADLGLPCHKCTSSKLTKEVLPQAWMRCSFVVNDFLSFVAILDC